MSQNIILSMLISCSILAGLLLFYLRPRLFRQDEIDVSQYHFDARTRLALALYKDGLYDQAIAIYSPLVEAFSEYPDIFCALGNCYLKKGQWPKAEECFQQALQQNPLYIEARFNLGETYLAQKKSEKAALEYLAILKMQPQFPDVLNKLALALLESRQYDKAEEYIRRALILNPDYEKAIETLKMIRLGRQQARDRSL
jgi:tetratricopeptide (TPR) repeat protein